MRAELCMEAIRLGRILAALAPAEAGGARAAGADGAAGLAPGCPRRARRRAGAARRSGPLALGPPADRAAAWARSRAHEQLGGELRPLRLQAAIAACHARAPAAADTDWPRVAALYGELARIAPSPVVELNRAVAVASAHGPEAGLVIVDGLAQDPAMRRYHLLRSVRADLLARLGRFSEAQQEIRRAAEMSTNERERAMLLERAGTYAWQAGRRRDVAGRRGPGGAGSVGSHSSGCAEQRSHAPAPLAYARAARPR